MRAPDLCARVRGSALAFIGWACFGCPPACVSTSTGRRSASAAKLRPAGSGGGNPFADGLNYFSPRGGAGGDGARAAFGCGFGRERPKPKLG